MKGMDRDICSCHRAAGQIRQLYTWLGKASVLGENREGVWSWATVRAGQGKAMAEARASRVKNQTGQGARTDPAFHQPSLQLGMPQAFTFISLEGERYSVARTINSCQIFATFFTILHFTFLTHCYIFPFCSNSALSLPISPSSPLLQSDKLLNP